MRKPGKVDARPADINERTAASARFARAFDFIVVSVALSAFAAIITQTTFGALGEPIAKVTAALTQVD